MSDTINQTEFTEDAPTQMSPQTAAVEAPGPSPVKKSKAPLLFALAGIVIVVLLLLGALKYSQRQSTLVTSTPTPQASEAPIETKGIRDEIAPYLQIIDKSNPEEDDHPFPPVNFDVRIKDPNSR